MGFFALILLLEFVLHKEGESVNITIDPQSVTLYGSQKTNNVTVKCAVSTCLPLYNLALSRAVGGNASKTVIDTDVTGSTATEIIPGATYSGSISERFIAVTLAEASCNDVGEYTCTATFKGLVENASLNLSAHGESEMIVAPNATQSYTVNDNLTLTCISRVEAGVQGQWMWERKLSQEVNWTEYSRTEYSHASNVTTQDPDNFCLNIWTSVLSRRLSLEDNKAEYRCSFTLTNNSSPSAVQVFKVPDVSLPGKVTEDIEIGVTSTYTSTPSCGIVFPIDFLGALQTKVTFFLLAGLLVVNSRFWLS